MLSLNVDKYTYVKLICYLVPVDALGTDRETKTKTLYNVMGRSMQKLLNNLLLYRMNTYVCVLNLMIRN